MKEPKIALPGGEWLKPLRKALVSAGIRWIQKSERNYRVDFPELNISGIIVRSNDVPRFVDQQDWLAAAGFTGSDILIDKKIRTPFDKEKDWIVPLSTKGPNSKIFLDLTPNAFEKFGTSPSLEQILEGVHRLCVS